MANLFGIHSATSLNDLINGVILVSGNSTAPDKDWWMIISSGGPDTRVQRALSLSDGSVEYHRYMAIGNWKAWVKKNSLTDADLTAKYNEGYQAGMAARGEVKMVTYTMPNADGSVYTINNLGFSGTPTLILVSTVNNVWIDCIYNNIGKYNGNTTDKVKQCLYSDATQKIVYLDRSSVFPTINANTVSINSSHFHAGVGDKTARVLIAKF